MRLEIIWNDSKCILFEKYSFYSQKAPIHVYHYEMPVPRKSVLLAMNLTGMYSEPVPTVPDTPVGSATLYLHRIRSSSSLSSVVPSSSSSNRAASLLTRPRVLADTFSAVQVQAIALGSHHLGTRNSTIIHFGMKSILNFPSQS
jgi:hypothetical protein